MSFRMIATCLAMLAFAGGILAAGCGGSDSPTSPPTTQPPAPPPTPTPAPPSVSRIEVSPNMVTLEVGKTQRFVATAKASDGTVIGGVNFTWSSSNTAVVTINSGGVATAVSAGTATIRATGNGVSSAPGTITVTVPPVSSVTISPSSAQELMVGEMTTFTATARTAGGAVRNDVSITWSSSDTNVVTITSAGVATAIAEGTATVRATAGGIASSPVTVIVTESPPPAPMVATVTVSPSEASIEKGDTQQFEVMAVTDDGTAISEVEIMWSSTNEMVATVDANGLATGVGTGEAMITAKADGVSGMATLTVTEPPPVVDRVDVRPASASIEEGETQQFSATAYKSDNTEITGKTFTWSSSNTAVATISTSGLATAQDAGSTMITASVDGKSGMAMLTVTAPPPPPPMLRSRTASISGTSSYPNTAGSVTFEEVSGGRLKLTITGMNTGGGIAAHLFLYTSASINWRNGPAPAGARHFGNVTRRPSFSETFTPSAGETIDSYSHVILHCAVVNMPLGSGSF